MFRIIYGQDSGGRGLRKSCELTSEVVRVQLHCVEMLLHVRADYSRM